MRNAWLIAAREYMENAQTKGFWIGLFLFPLILIGMIQVPRWLEEKATPTRYFVLVDQSGQFEKTIEEGLAANHRRDVAVELFSYIKKYSKKGSQANSRVDFENLPADMLDPAKFLESRGASIDSLMEMLGEFDLQSFIKQYASQLVEERPEFVEPRRKIVRVDSPAAVDQELEVSEIVNNLRPYLIGEQYLQIHGEKKELFAFIFVPNDIENAILHPVDFKNPNSWSGLTKEKVRGVEYWCTNVTDKDLSKIVEESINKEIRRREYEAKNVDRQIVSNIQDTRIAFASFDPKKEEGKEAVSAADKIRQWSPVAFVYILWIAIFSIVSMLLNNTVEEKSNRLVEVLLSSVTPWELMLGKLQGIAAIGLTMLGAWILCGMGILLYYAGQEVDFALQAFEVVKTSGLLPSFIIYFIFGYLMYAGIFLALGSMCNTLKEAQNLMGPVMMIMIVPLVTMMFIPKDPNGTLATTLSWIPFYTPFIMMNRAAADPPMFDLVGTMILMVISTAVILYLSGKIFRIGILRTGQPPKIVEVLRWLKN